MLVLRTHLHDRLPQAVIRRDRQLPQRRKRLHLRLVTCAALVHAKQHLDQPTGNLAVPDDPGDEVGRFGDGVRRDVGGGGDGREEVLERDKVGLEEALGDGVLLRVGGEFAVGRIRHGHQHRKNTPRAPAP